MKKKIVLPLFLWLFVLPALAQQAKFTISGTVREAGSQEKLPGVTVANLKTREGTATNNFGFYSITLQPDTVELIFSYVGYTPVKKKFVLKADTVVNIDLGVVELKTVEISAEQQESISDNTQMSQVSIPVEQIKQIPALLGEKDVLKVIQLMPGVQKGQEGSSGFYVRGGGPDQNLIILDDATVYNAFHLFGFFSLFNGDALKSVELTKGGFPARYGGRLSSVLEMQMKDGDRQHFHGEAGIGLISSRLMLEGPILKGKSSFIVSGRRTYIDVLSIPFQKAANPEGGLAGYFFYDLNAKANYEINAKNTLYLSGYFGRDKFYARFNNSGSDRSSRASLSWGNATGTLRWNHIWNSRLFSNSSLIFTNYQLGIGLRENFSGGDFFELNYNSGIRDYSFKHDFEFVPSPRHYIRFGLMTTYHQFRPSAYVVDDSFSGGSEQKAQLIEAWESGIYAEDDWTLTSRLKVNMGVRLSYFTTQKKNYWRPEPRIAARYILRENLSLKASWAIMNQYLHLLSNTGVGLPTDLWVPATKRVSPQRSWQAAAGIAHDIPKHKLMVSLEGYYKRSFDIIGYKEGASFLAVGDLGGNGEPVSWEDNVTAGQAWSYGLEFLVQRKFGKFTGWIGYTLSWTQLQFDSLNFGKKFYARYDRRHDISLVGIYKLNDNITLSATWVYGTGNAITLPQAEYTLPAHSPGAPGGGNWFVTDFGEKNSFRMAAYHRLDIGVQFHKKLKRSERTFELSAYNVYSRQNPFFYYVGNDSQGNRRLRQVSLFPIIPSVSWTWKF
ncbi:MAG: TonB-dependent receptor [Bacteroidetes bacterium]|nr:TonB-dependent receptor [Bacteroidota bacterium]